MTKEDLIMLSEIGCMSECLRWALHATSFAQTQSDGYFDKTDRLQEAYVILHEVYLEAKEYESIDDMWYISHGLPIPRKES